MRGLFIRPMLSNDYEDRDSGIPPRNLELENRIIRQSIRPLPTLHKRPDLPRGPLGFRQPPDTQLPQDSVGRRGCGRIAEVAQIRLVQSKQLRELSFAVDRND